MTDQQSRQYAPDRVASAFKAFVREYGLMERASAGCQFPQFGPDGRRYFLLTSPFREPIRPDFFQIDLAHVKPQCFAGIAIDRILEFPFCDAVCKQVEKIRGEGPVVAGLAASRFCLLHCSPHSLETHHRNR
jgi:hypothetical protein